MMLSRALLLLVAVVLALSTADAKPTKHRGPSRAMRHSSKKNPTRTFCQAFNAQCYMSAVQQHKQSSGGSEEVTVVHVCRRNGRKYSKSFTFGCRADGVDITQQVLDKVGGGYTVTTTASSPPATSGGANASPVSVTATASTSTVTTFVATTTTTSTSYTSTSTQSLQGAGDPVPITVVSIPNTPSPRKRADHIDSTQFCSAFSAGCQKECARVSSKPKHTVCQAGQQSSTATQYRLACYCRNGKSETQHALRDTLNQEHVSTVSAQTTSTSLFTTTVATTTPLTTTTATATTTSIVSTTKVVLAATGAVQVLAYPAGTSMGYLNQQTVDGPQYQTSVNRAGAQDFLAVRDAHSNIWSLQHADGSGLVAVVEQYADGNFGTNSAAYGGLVVGTSSSCGSSATQVGPPQPFGPNFYACETYVFGLQSDATTQTSGGATLNAAFEWVNPGQTTASQYDWDYDARDDFYFGTGDTVKFTTNYLDYRISKVTMRFPA